MPTDTPTPTPTPAPDLTPSPITNANVFTVGTYEDDNVGINYSSVWVVYNDPAHSAGHEHNANTDGASASFIYDGVGAKVYSSKDTSGYGEYQVYIDGVPTRTINLTSDTTEYDQLVYDTAWDSIPAGQHTVMLVCLGPLWVGLDKIEVYGEVVQTPDPTPTVTYSPTPTITPTPDSNTLMAGTYEDDVVSINYSGNWVVYNDPAQSAGHEHDTMTVGASVTFTYDGAGAQVYSSKDTAGYGHYQVYIDEVPMSTVSLTSASTEYDQLIYDTAWDSVPAGQHTVKLVCLDPLWVGLDKIVVYSNNE